MGERVKGKSSSSSSNREELETSKADTAVWLMKCPPVVSRSWLSQPQTTIINTMDFDDLTPSPPPLLAKITLSIDPLATDSSSSSSSSQVRFSYISLSRVFSYCLVSYVGCCYFDK